MFKSMRLMMDAFGNAFRSDPRHQGRHRRGAAQKATADPADQGAAAADLCGVVPNIP